jgi:hypothetical protein
MEFIKRYFETLEEANAFIQEINTLIGIPVSDNAVTRTYTEPQEDENGIFVEYEKSILSEK